LRLASTISTEREGERERKGWRERNIVLPQ